MTRKEHGFQVFDAGSLKLPGARRQDKLLYFSSPCLGFLIVEV